MSDSDPTAIIEEHEQHLDLAEGTDEIEAIVPETNGRTGAPGVVSASDEAALAAVASALAPPVEEPTAIGDLDAASLDGLGAARLPATPLTAVKRKVFGRYRSTGTPFQVELRVDIDGPAPTMRVSADYYTVAGATVSYFGSMRVDAPAVTVTETQIVIKGLGRFTWAATSPRIRITIPRVPLLSPPPAATMAHLSLTGVPAATYICRHMSPAFRTMIFEEDRQDTVPAVFASYNTGSLPSGGPARSLSVVSAFAEAGIQMLTTGGADVVATGEAGANAAWSDAELHAAMVNHFSRWKDIPQWAVWLLHARLHDLGTGLLGIMFDQQGKQRQGCAVFYDGIGGATADKQRLQLYTCVHELGHCFNLMHSWQKSLAMPPQPNRPLSYSWMNYPWNYPGGGAAGFWSGFGFRFDAQELVHIRHGFQSEVIMGGNPFRVGAALEDLTSWSDPVEDRSGLRLELEAPSTFAYGEPVTVQVRLHGGAANGVLVTRHLRPRNGQVQIAIAGPNGQVRLFEPLLHHCVSDADAMVLDAAKPSHADTAFIHYGKDGFYFDQPGTYRLRARYTAPDGSIIVSPITTVRVRPPVSAEDEAVAELLFGDEQGTLMYLVGSDLDELRSGNEALTKVREEHPQHPLADIARVIQGVNQAREFKLVQPDNEVRVRKPDTAAATELLGAVFDVGGVSQAAATRGIDDPTRMAAAATHIRTEVGPTLPAAIDGYLRSRRREIGAEIATMDAE